VCVLGWLVSALHLECVRVQLRRPVALEAARRPPRGGALGRAQHVADAAEQVLSHAEQLLQQALAANEPAGRRRAWRAGWVGGGGGMEVVVGGGMIPCGMQHEHVAGVGAAFAKQGHRMRGGWRPTLADWLAGWLHVGTHRWAPGGRGVGRGKKVGGARTRW
jgi:hypothetical protein